MLIRKSLDIAPFGKPRPRVTKNGTFMPKEYQSWRAAVRGEFGLVYPGPDDVLALSITAVVPVYKSWSKRKQRQMIGRDARCLPDVDNLAGSVMDAILLDDRAVGGLTVSRVWGTAGRLHIEVRILWGRDGARHYQVTVDRPDHEQLLVHLLSDSDFDARVQGIYAALKLDGEQVGKDVYDTVRQYPLYGSVVIGEAW